MVDKHPRGRWQPLEPVAGRPPGAGEAGLGLCEKVIAATKPIIRVGPRGLRPGHLKPLFQGFFRDKEAKGGVAALPRPRKALPQRGGATMGAAGAEQGASKEVLTPPVKAAPPPGREPDCRPAKGRDMDISDWTKQRKHCKEVSRQLIPQ